MQRAETQYSVIKGNVDLKPKKKFKKIRSRSIAQNNFTQAQNLNKGDFKTNLQVSNRFAHLMK